MRDAESCKKFYCLIHRQTHVSHRTQEATRIQGMLGECTVSECGNVQSFQNQKCLSSRRFPCSAILYKTSFRSVLRHLTIKSFIVFSNQSSFKDHSRLFPRHDALHGASKSFFRKMRLLRVFLQHTITKVTILLRLCTPHLCVLPCPPGAFRELQS